MSPAISHEPASLAPTLTDDETDDILYLSRANEATELSAFLTELSTRYSCAQSAILAAAVDPESKNNILHYTGANGHNDILSLVQNLCNDESTTLHALINAPNSSGNTPLHWASLNGHASFVSTLLDLGADPSALNNLGHDAVFEAESNGKNEVVELILRKSGVLEQAIGGMKAIEGEASGSGPADEEDMEVGEEDEDGGIQLEEEAQSNGHKGPTVATVEGELDGTEEVRAGVEAIDVETGEVGKGKEKGKARVGG
ncbi:ankyrin repeat-containing protein [Coniosporium apollinis]|uniref:Ankyrin repeat-containing protein n=2 Tax=Coniosporium TaxID=2810619 RepID=A0ABQ9NPL6_9PEZI|nr:ankyrin repeat-containing protein [Cladosporium sp. JES 115]KAJ9659542.1 ankyrin repeat-containing protein [Coniosporium apollinis]